MSFGGGCGIGGGGSGLRERHGVEEVRHQVAQHQACMGRLQRAVQTRHRGEIGEQTIRALHRTRKRKQFRKKSTIQTNLQRARQSEPGQMEPLAVCCALSRVLERDERDVLVGVAFQHHAHCRVLRDLRLSHQHLFGDDDGGAGRQLVGPAVLQLGGAGDGRQVECGQQCHLRPAATAAADRDDVREHEEAVTSCRRARILKLLDQLRELRHVGLQTQ